MPLPDFETLGSFYLGKSYDLESGARGEGLVLYDSKDLVTHAVCVGMTGSGKTGLCVTLIEEAAIDGVPSIIIDPKGDLSNLLLTFPSLAPQDFRPWINEDDARRKGMTPDEYAAKQAETWKNGLAEWGQDSGRIQRLRDAADFAVYTPGSTAGLPVSVLKSFDPPPMEIIEDNELFGERVSSTVTSLLGLLSIDADPLQSREHILLSTLFGQAWAQGRSLDLPSLIQLIQRPPVQRIGVMEVETFFPSQDRFALAMQINNLVASPGFARWIEGEPLDIRSILYTPGGKPRVAIFSISHLSDPERMFFVSLLLNQTLGWVRSQPGTTSLRAIVYMDEIAGYFPPTANPPSKRPLLTLMKQARAFGVGVVLATQNPVDLDYKGLSNAGTWFLGRLQTERDKARVLDGLEGAMAAAGAAFDRATLDRSLSTLGNRVFLMNNVHEDGPVVMETRWAMSYLRGPLTRTQIKSLMDVRRAGQTAASANEATPSSAAPPAAPVIQTQSAAAAPAPTPAPAPAPVNADSIRRPVLPPDIPQYFLPSRAPSTVKLLYHPMVMGLAKVYYADPKAAVDQDVTVSLLAPINSGPVPIDWEQALETDHTDADVDRDPLADASFSPLPAEAGKPKSYETWKKSLTDSLFRTHSLELFKCPGLKLNSKPGEKEADFKLRLQQAVRERRDEMVEKLRTKFAPKATQLQERIRRAQQQVQVQKEQASSAKVSTALSFGAAIFGAFMGRKVASSGNIGRAATAARGVSRSSKESSDVDRAEETLESIQKQYADLEAQFQADVDAVAADLDAAAAEIETVALKPKKTNITVRAVVLAWAPFAVGPGGNEAPAW